jgi:hypothetical protein
MRNGARYGNRQTQNGIEVAGGIKKWACLEWRWR